MGQQKMAAVRRLNGELSKHGKSMPPGFKAGPHGDNMMQWDAFIPGAPGTAWEGGIFKLRLDYPNDYPFKPPVVQFETPLYHPNFSKEGLVCLSAEGQVGTKRADPPDSGGPA